MKPGIVIALLMIVDAGLAMAHEKHATNPIDLLILLAYAVLTLFLFVCLVVASKSKKGDD
jgi:hypothetical protein